MKKLYRSKENKVMGGVLGGLGEYFDIDPVVLRVIFILLGAITGFIPFLIGYIIVALIVPTDHKEKAN